MKPTPSREAAQPAAASPKPAPRKRVTQPKVASAAPAARSQVTPDQRRAMIAEAAYLRAERRGFTNGNEVDDWIAAEKEVDALLNADSKAGPQ